MINQLRAIIIILFLLTACSTGYYFYDGIYNYPNAAKLEKSFDIQKGQNATEIAFALAKTKLIQDPYPLLAYLYATGNYKNIKAGQYVLNSKMTGQQISEEIIKGQSSEIKLTIIEGWDLAQIAQYLQGKGFGKESDFYSLAGSPAQTYGQNSNLSENIFQYSKSFDFLKNKPVSASLEGFIFPDTYFVSTESSLEKIILKMLSNFNSKLTPKMKADIESQNKNIYQIITMASIIEKEVQTIEDKKIVSGILWNRLEIGQPLQADATVLYALQMQSADKVYKKYTEIDSPYNTYKYKGLPFGPISNPGIDSIVAAIYPEKTNYWYYLSKPDGTTIFSKTLTEHNIAKAKYLK
ncbi:MAG: endolytic transglycosylase MltG [Candidatus Paceibacterota bacterium]